MSDDTTAQRNKTMTDLNDLWRDIDALGGAVCPGDPMASGYSEALNDVIDILEQYGFAEGAAPAENNRRTVV